MKISLSKLLKEILFTEAEVLKNVHTLDDRDKAIKIKFHFNGKDIETWLPKGSIKIKPNNEIEVNGHFWKHKKDEILQTYFKPEKKPFVKLFGSTKEFDKSYGIMVTVYEAHTEQSRNSYIFFPKSLTQKIDSHYIIVPSWIFEKNIKEKEDSYKHGAYQFVNSISVENEYEYISNVQ